jgi:hypothetical protein
VTAIFPASLHYSIIPTLRSARLENESRTPGR